MRLFNITLFVALCLVLGRSSSAQISSVGLVAHWQMTGNAADSSGNAHHGIMNNITSAIGKNGLPNTALYFNGINSYIDVPSSSGLDVSLYSICAIVKPQGYYTGTCQNNAILRRGFQNMAGHYALEFQDNAYDGLNCGFVDTSKNVFTAAAGTVAYGPTENWHYSPQIQTGQWYRVVATFDGTAFRIYVDGILKATQTGVSGSIGSSSEGLTIGSNAIPLSSAFPYWFNGIMDDVRIYNRVLTASEILAYDIVPASVGVSSVDVDANGLQVYPNPARNTLQLQWQPSAQDILDIRIYNAQGQVVLNTSAEDAQSTKTLDITNLPAGMYWMRVVGAKGEQVKAFDKQ